MLAFDDNKLASTLFGQYGQNLALLERKLDVVADSRGNHVTIEGTREACDQARRVLETLYEQLKNGGDLVVGDVEGAIRQAMAQGSLFDGDPADGASEFCRHLAAQAHRARPHCGTGRLYPRAQASLAGVRHRARRYRQDLACGRACGVAVRAQGSRPHHPVAAGGGSGRAARISARRHAREGRSVSAPDLRRPVRPDGHAHCRARDGGRRDRDRPARLHARTHAAQCRWSFSTRRRIPLRCR